MTPANDERQRAVQFLTTRYTRARAEAFDLSIDFHEVYHEFDDAVELAKQAMLAATLAGNTEADRQRLVHTMKEIFFATLDRVEEDGHDVDERIAKAINGAERDILGEHAPPDLWRDPDAEMESAEKLGITAQSRRMPNGSYERRWVCATCQETGPWVESTFFCVPRLEHASWHTANAGS